MNLSWIEFATDLNPCLKINNRMNPVGYNYPGALHLGLNRLTFFLKISM